MSDKSRLKLDATAPLKLRVFLVAAELSNLVGKKIKIEILLDYQNTVRFTTYYQYASFSRNSFQMNEKIGKIFPVYQIHVSFLHLYTHFFCFKWVVGSW